MKIIKAQAYPVYDRYQRRADGRVNVFVNYFGETVLENLMIGRRNRPHVTYIESVREVLEWLDIARDGQKIRFRWSEKAGCEMCPCSPGFVVSTSSIDRFKAGLGYKRDLNISLTISDDEYVAENRQLVQNAINETPDATSTGSSENLLDEIAEALETQAALKQEFSS